MTYRRSIKMTPEIEDRIEHIFKFMEWDQLSNGQLDLIASFEIQFKDRGWLNERQVEILEDVFEKAAGRA